MVCVFRVRARHRDHGGKGLVVMVLTSVWLKSGWRNVGVYCYYHVIVPGEAGFRLGMERSGGGLTVVVEVLCVGGPGLSRGM